MYTDRTIRSECCLSLGGICMSSLPIHLYSFLFIKSMLAIRSRISSYHKVSMISCGSITFQKLMKFFIRSKRSIQSKIAWIYC